MKFKKLPEDEWLQYSYFLSKIGQKLLLQDNAFKVSVER